MDVKNFNEILTNQPSYTNLSLFGNLDRSAFSDVNILHSYEKIYGSIDKNKMKRSGFSSWLILFAPHGEGVGVVARVKGNAVVHNMDPMGPCLFKTME